MIWAKPADMGVKYPIWSGCPYLGLVPFEERDARVFYGRNELVRQLVQRLLEHLDGGEYSWSSGHPGQASHHC